MTDTIRTTMHCYPILVPDPCNDPRTSPDGSVIRWALTAREQPPCASHVWQVRIWANAPDCARTETEGVAHSETLAQTAAQLMAHLEAPWYEAIAARESRAAIGTPPALEPTADLSANPKEPHDP